MLHLRDPLQVVLHLLIVLLDHSVLILQPFHEVLLEHLELDGRLLTYDLQDEQGTQDVVLLDLVQGPLQVLLALIPLQIPEVSEGLDPQVPCHLRVCFVPILLTDLKHLFLVLLLDVVVEELLLQLEPFTAALDSIRVVVYLEEEEHVVLVQLGVVPLYELIDLHLYVPVISHQLPDAREVLVDLPPIQVALQQPMIQVYCCHLVEDVGEVLADLLDDELQVVLQLVDVIHEDLQQVFNPDSLVFLDLVLLVGFTDKLLLLGELCQRFGDVFDDPLDLLGGVLHLERVHLLRILLLTLLQELRPIHLQALYLVL
mmetsp:Transcript_14536/g.14146  ORF Transcript_14536/g.14146 Transcript_14536/m.14146 type:complete len:314 (+) Transcript_14536:376-1317(+)